jgi:hypothetical protein
VLVRDRERLKGKEGKEGPEGAVVDVDDGAFFKVDGNWSIASPSG